MAIKGPKLPIDHPERIVECQFTMEPLFQAAAVEALAAGWTESDVATAMLNLAVAQIKGNMANRATEAEISVARGMFKSMKGSDA